MWAEALVRRGIVGAVTWVDGHADAAGCADLATGEPLTVAHRFRIGSCTKTYVAYLTTLLVDDLDEPAVEEVTFRQLLTHRSGLFDATWDGELWGEWIFGPPGSVDPRSLVAVSLSYPRRFAAGAEQQYSNTNYDHVGVLLEDRTGTPLPQLLRTHVFEPLALTRTTFETDPVLPDGASHGYAMQDGMMPVDEEPRDVSEYLIGAWACGAITADVADVARFYAYAVPRLVDEELGLHPVETRCGTAWGHSGGIAGYLAFVRCARDGSHVALAFSNTQGVKVSRALEHAAARLYCD